MTPVRHEVPLENDVLEYADCVGEGRDCGGVDIAVFCSREDYVQIIEEAVPAKVGNGDGVARDTRQLLTNGLEETPSLGITLDRSLRKRHCAKSSDVSPTIIWLTSPVPDTLTWNVFALYPAGRRNSRPLATDWAWRCWPSAISVNWIG